MNLNQIESRKQSLWQYEHDLQMFAKTINDINPESKRIRIIGTLSFQELPFLVKDNFVSRTEADLNSKTVDSQNPRLLHPLR